ncbi:hypothetical protein K493DRAFT_319328 [Basidiobolus meristosporus CBS 931.73]|uniref:Cyclin N-terminal domain-containing protein n=1 Tax=Basidiobolus meristosporus CBS 931.73 TaxID=1314790 RepID=A0A1Y1XT00_9FUNG|nr:hypothetical protein K493DRAFT_319328 [Basidiobolus meristosporus CBS 931.73]|eukprot:ORX88626.1 hypothetical protein K493DRAFT_319328 [Basidiobolus meristosporus CBS 931.73]
MPGTHILLSDLSINTKSTRDNRAISDSAAFFADVVSHMWSNNPYGSAQAFLKFCTRLFQITQPSNSTILLALNYIYRYKETSPYCSEVSGTEYYIAVVSLMLANKYHEDKCYSNRSWAKVSGLDVSQVSRMELSILAAFNWSIKVDNLEFDSWSQFLGQYWSAVIEFRGQSIISEQNLDSGVQDCRRQGFISTSASITSIS